MSAADRDEASLRDMLRFSEIAALIVDDHSFAQYEKDVIRVLALERALELIGEAARRVSEPKRNALKSIPWKFIIGQRNVLAHMYGSVDDFQIYRTAREDVPELIGLLKGALR